MGSEYESSSDGEKGDTKAEPTDSWSESSDEYGDYGEENVNEARLGEIAQPDEQNRTIAIDASGTPSRHEDTVKSPLQVRTNVHEPVSRQRSGEVRSGLSPSRVSNYTSLTANKPLPFNAVRYIAIQLKTIVEEGHEGQEQY